MFDVGFWEIALIGLITLLVVGPERLPGLAQKAGQYMNKVRSFLADTQSKVESELHSDEIKNFKDHLNLEDEKNSILDIVKDDDSAKK